MKNTISMIFFLVLYGCTNQLEIDKVKVDKAFNKTNLPFAVLGVSLDKNDPVFYSYGDSNPDAIFEIASMTKAITSTAVMQLVEKGKIDLDLPIEEYLPEINQIKILNKDLSRSERGNPITMRHLLTHTSGFVYFFNSARATCRRCTASGPSANLRVLICVHIFAKSKSWLCLLYTSPSPRDRTRSRMPSSA